MSTLIEVCGASHSGTTMLDLMLGNAPNAFSCGEVYQWFRPWRTHHFEIDCACGENPCPYWSRIQDVKENIFHREAFQRFGVDYVVDSSKDICWILDSNLWGAENRIRVTNLLIWKQPIALAHSYWKRGWSISDAIHGFVRYHTRFFETGLPFFTVYFPDLTREPKTKLEEICNVLGMNYFEGKESFWTKRHHHLFGSGGIRRQVQQGRSRIDTVQEFPDAFLTAIKPFAKEIEGEDIGLILSILREHDISNFISAEISFLPSGLVPNPSVKRPLWYYMDRIRRLYKRYFPEPWAPNLYVSQPNDQ